MLRNYRKPLVIAAPKIGLKHPMAVSTLDDFSHHTSFKPILVDNFGEGKSKKVILCSGKVYYDLKQAIKEGDPAVTVIRVEELAPFPSNLIQDQLDKIEDKVNAEVMWVQEESINQAGFQFAKLHVDRMLENLDFENQEMQVIGRESQHAFVTGAGTDYKAQNQNLWSKVKKFL